VKNEKVNEIKYKILKNRLQEVLSKNPKKISKILSFLVKRHKNV